MLLPTPSAEKHTPQRREDFTPNLTFRVQELTSSAADSPASQSRPPAGARRKPMSAGSGPSSPVSFASLDPDGSWLRTYPDSSVQATLLGPPLVRFSGTWPKWGSMRGGEVFAHPTLEHVTGESGSSSSRNVPTPTASDHIERRSTNDGKGPSGGELNYETGKSVSLGERFASDPENDGRERTRNVRTADEPRRRAETDRETFAWGPYESAIRRWEQALNRCAPAPVDDKGRLAPAFVEWMMGFPQGWTDAMTRTQALKALGNAVVPQQAIAALRSLS